MIKSILKGKKLHDTFYRRDALIVAKELLGKIFIKIEGGEILGGVIVETEAYKADMDEASHSFRGKTKRNEVMFEEGGLLYVYFTYGVHFCANVVTGKIDSGDAVLIRAMEPLEGLELMAQRRFGKTLSEPGNKKNLTNGPAKICQAFGLDRRFNGHSLNSTSLFILNRPEMPTEKILSTKRIGIKKSIDLPWRFYIRDNEFVSKR